MYCIKKKSMKKAKDSYSRNEETKKNNTKMILVSQPTQQVLIKGSKMNSFKRK